MPPPSLIFLQLLLVVELGSACKECGLASFLEEGQYQRSFGVCFGTAVTEVPLYDVDGFAACANAAADTTTLPSTKRFRVRTDGGCELVDPVPCGSAGNLLNDTVYAKLPGTGNTYSKAHPPGNLPVTVLVSGVVVKVNSLDVTKQIFSFGAYLRHRWFDDRLQWDPEDFGGQKRMLLAGDAFVWRPDTFLPTAEDVDTIDGGEFFEINSNGVVTWSRRIHASHFCEMKLHYHPFENLECNADVESYSYTISSVRYRVLGSDTTKQQAVLRELEASADDKRLVDVDDTIDLFYPEVLIDNQCNTVGDLNKGCVPNGEVGIYDIDLLDAREYNKSYSNRPFTGVRWTFKFSQDVGTVIWTTFIPLWLIYGLSIGSCFIDPHTVPARVSMGITTVLVMITQLSSFRADIPDVGYITAMDVFFVITFVLVVLNVAEFFWIHRSLVRLDKQNKKEECRRAVSKEAEKNGEESQALFGEDTWELFTDKPTASAWVQASFDMFKHPKSAVTGPTEPLTGQEPDAQEDQEEDECVLDRRNCIACLVHLNVPAEQALKIVKDSNWKEFGLRRFKHIVESHMVCERFGVAGSRSCSGSITEAWLMKFERFYRYLAIGTYVLFNIIWFSVVLSKS